MKIKWGCGAPNEADAIAAFLGVVEKLGKLVGHRFELIERWVRIRVKRDHHLRLLASLHRADRLDIHAVGVCHRFDQALKCLVCGKSHADKPSV